MATSSPWRGAAWLWKVSPNMCVAGRPPSVFSIALLPSKAFITRSAARSVADSRGIAG
ncbi:hypothetical protein ABMY26_15450 [Azospirillum sp. HJ39]|uniref:hypothetical protein n=1 Tax=Azospirillum sp. HJ39 TaxID=3159496 RepID=UPI0035560DF7